MKIWNGHTQNNQYACMWAQSCLTICVPKDCSLPGSFVYGIFFFQERILEWVTISSSRGSTQSRDQSLVSCIVSHIGRRLLYCQATWETPLNQDKHKENNTKMHYRKISEKWQREILFKKQSEGRRGLKATFV